MCKIWKVIKKIQVMWKVWEKIMETDHWKIYLEQQINKLALITIGNNVEKRGWAWNVNTGLNNSLCSVCKRGLLKACK